MTTVIWASRCWRLAGDGESLVKDKKVYTKSLYQVYVCADKVLARATPYRLTYLCLMTPH